MMQRYGLSLLLAVTLASGCTGQAQRQTREERRQFQIVMETKLSQLEQRTDALAHDASNLVAVTNAGEIEDLQRSQREFREKMVSLAGASESQWEEAKTIMESEYRDLERRCAELTNTVRQASISGGVDSLGTGGR